MRSRSIKRRGPDDLGSEGLEDDLLYRLANSTGNLLDDTQLIEVLGVTKATAGEVKEKLQNAAEANERISVAREEYRPVATRGSLLYFLVVDMAAINNMYMVSLQQFLELFDFSIDNSDKAPLASISTCGRGRPSAASPACPTCCRPTATRATPTPRG